MVGNRVMMMTFGFNNRISKQIKKHLREQVLYGLQYVKPIKAPFSCQAQERVKINV